MGDIETEVEFILADQGENTLIQLKHYNVKDSNLQINISAGWHAHLGILLDKMNGTKPESFLSRHKVLKVYYGQD